ncbi:hypothetical protein [Streptomyces sp. NPDC005494]|uniref:hypothetical protein n=1 Tax=Streptomyces sp. NPDC005494 TaxID=3364715 RepID=UPI00367B79BD
MTMFRYEPVPRDTGLDEALAARTADAAWFLARQYAFGEFRGDDAASPVTVSLAQETHRLDGWRPRADAEWQPYEPDTMVLEALVEREPGNGIDARLAMAGALRWRRALTAAGHLALLPAFTRVCPFATGGPLAPTGLSAAVRDRLPDPVALAPWLARIAERDKTAAEEFGVPDTGPDRDALARAAAAWLTWWHAHVPAAAPPQPEKPPEAWNPERLEYAFEVRASGLPGLELRAGQYQGGHLDWWAVDAAPDARLPVAEAAVKREKRTIVPTPAVYGGMPVSRFWEMEDARIDFGSVDASPVDLGRLMLIAFATVYGNDWFCVPLPLVVGSLSRVVDCSVQDVFGGRTPLAHATARDSVTWNLFGLGDPAGGGIPPAEGMAMPPSPWIYRPASLPNGLESPAVESVLLLRDEQANLGWAVEEAVADRAEDRVDRYARWIASTSPPAAAPAAAGPPGEAAARYLLATEVPAHWYPLVPETLADEESVRLRLARLDRDDASLESPLGRLLAETAGLHEQEVPRSGIRVERSRQFTRWQDGSAHAWTTRRKVSGTGCGSSGLRFDVLKED